MPEPNWFGIMGLSFLERDGRDLERRHRPDVAQWIDIWLGWRGAEWAPRVAVMSARPMAQCRL